jgi:hypothetical protein
MERQRRIVKPPSNGGKECEPHLEETSGCPKSLEIMRINEKRMNEVVAALAKGEDIPRRHLLLSHEPAVGTPIYARVTNLRKGDDESTFCATVEACASDWHEGTVMKSARDEITISTDIASTVLELQSDKWYNEKAQQVFIVKRIDAKHFNPTGKVDCEWDDWHEWDACNCAMKQRNRVRDIRNEPRFGGENCGKAAKAETGECSCGKPKSEHYCIPEDWIEWGACSVSCGIGSRKRERSYVPKLITYTEAPEQQTTKTQQTQQTQQFDSSSSAATKLLSPGRGGAALLPGQGKIGIEEEWDQTSLASEVGKLKVQAALCGSSTLTDRPSSKRSKNCEIFKSC